MLLALVAIMSPRARSGTRAFFYVQTFMEKFLKVDAGHHQPADDGRDGGLSAPLYVFFGWLSDKVGRKPVMLSRHDR